MRRTVLQNRNQGSRGVTLVEVMISLVVLLIVSMGLLQASLLSVDSNVRNQLRDEAVSIASETMANARGHFSRLADTGGNCTQAALTNMVLIGEPGYPYSATVNRTFRSQTVPFTRCGIVEDLDAESKQVTLTVTWDYRGETFTHSIISIVRNR